MRAISDRPYKTGQGAKGFGGGGTKTSLPHRFAELPRQREPPGLSEQALKAPSQSPAVTALPEGEPRVLAGDFT